MPIIFFPVKLSRRSRISFKGALKDSGKRCMLHEVSQHLQAKAHVGPSRHIQLQHIQLQGSAQQDSRNGFWNKICSFVGVPTPWLVFAHTRFAIIVMQFQQIFSSKSAVTQTNDPVRLTSPVLPVAYRDKVCGKPISFPVSTIDELRKCLR